MCRELLDGLIFISFRCFFILELMKKNLIYLKHFDADLRSYVCENNNQPFPVVIGNDNTVVYEKERRAECCFKSLRIMHLRTFWILPLLNEKHVDLYLHSSNTSLFRGWNIAYTFNNKWAHDELQATKLSPCHSTHRADQLKFTVYFPAWIKFHYISMKFKSNMYISVT